MIDLGLSDEYLKGFNDRLKDIPFDDEKSDDWKMGWHNADQQKRNEKRPTLVWPISPKR